MNHAGVSDRVSDQLLQICSRNSARAAFPLMLSIFLTALILLNKVDPQLLQLWVAASCTAILIRVLLLHMANRSKRLNAHAQRLVATVVTLILGIAIGSVLYFFPIVGLFERAMLTAILLGICTVSHSTNFGYPPLLLSYIVPLLGSLGVLWIANIDDLMHPALAAAIGASTLIVALTMLMNGRFMFRVFSLSIESSLQLEEKSTHLSEALLLTEQAKAEAESSSQSKSRFIAAASHDLRQPVHVLNMLTATMQRETLTPRATEIVDNMTIAVNSLSSQLNALLDISELDSGSVKPQVQSVNLSRLVSGLWPELQQLADDKRIRLICNLPSDLFVRTDPAMLSRIIRNLCGNAIKYTFSGSVSITASNRDDNVCLTINDTGIGIGHADCNKIFEEFYQIANPGRDKSRGMGLGLSIVERLIRKLRHTIRLESQVGKGTMVSIDIQRCTQEQLALLPEPEPAPPTCVTLKPGLHVHLVEDEQAVRRSMELFLQSRGCRVTASVGSADAIRQLSQSPPDVALIDLTLQDGDSGLTVVDWLRSGDRSIQFAIVTGESLSDGELARRYPDVLQLQKPVSNENLLELLDYLANQADTESQTYALYPIETP